MDHCPAEIHALIFAYACTDDGPTGRALARVSRYIRRASLPFQWQCLAIAGVAQAAGFVRTLHEAGPGSIANVSARPIYHLFLSTRVPAQAEDARSLASTDEWAARLHLQEAILRAAAPTLRTLTFVSCDAVVHGAAALAALFRVPLPRLRELTLRARCTPAQLMHGGVRETEWECEEKPARESALRPQLRRLHLACAFHGLAYGTGPTHALVRALAPRATHLRLSMLDAWGARRVAEVLHAECAARGLAPPVLARPRVEARRVAWPAVLPPDVRTVVLRPPPPTAGPGFFCACCMDARGDADVLRVFAALAAHADGRFVNVPARGQAGYGYEEAHADWLARIDGGAGCWEYREADGEGEEDGAEACCLHRQAASGSLNGPRAARGATSKGEAGIGVRSKRGPRKKVVRLMKKLRSWWDRLNAADDDAFGLPAGAVA